MEYNQLMQKIQESQKRMKTKEINVCDLLTPQERDTIAKIIDKRVYEQYPINNEFKWTFECTGHFIV